MGCVVSSKEGGSIRVARIEVKKNYVVRGPSQVIMCRISKNRDND